MAKGRWICAYDSYRGSVHLVHEVKDRIWNPTERLTVGSHKQRPRVYRVMRIRAQTQPITRTQRVDQVTRVFDIPDAVNKEHASGGSVRASLRLGHEFNRVAVATTSGPSEEFQWFVTFKGEQFEDLWEIWPVWGQEALGEQRKQVRRPVGL
jgi:hypothetical protein